MIRAILLGALVLATAACTVKPLHSSGPGLTIGSGGSGGKVESISSIAIAPADTREEQEVRNHLIFLFHHGQGEPAEPLYRLSLDVVTSTAGVTSVPVTDAGDAMQPTAGVVTLSASYILTEISTSEAMVAGTRSVSATFDRPHQQQFAASRAERDAEDRAARELAEFIRLAIASELRVR